MAFYWSYLVATGSNVCKRCAKDSNTGYTSLFTVRSTVKWIEENGNGDIATDFLG